MPMARPTGTRAATLTGMLRALERGSRTGMGRHSRPSSAPALACLEVGGSVHVRVCRRGCWHAVDFSRSGTPHGPACSCFAAVLLLLVLVLLLLVLAHVNSIVRERCRVAGVDSLHLPGGCWSCHRCPHAQSLNSRPVDSRPVSVRHAAYFGRCPASRSPCLWTIRQPSPCFHQLSSRLCSWPAACITAC